MTLFRNSKTEKNESPMNKEKTSIDKPWWSGKENSIVEKKAFWNGVAITLLPESQLTVKYVEPY